MKTLNTVFGKIKIVLIPAKKQASMFELSKPESEWTGIDPAHALATVLDDEGNETGYVMRGENERDALKIIMNNLLEGEFNRLTDVDVWTA